MITLAAVTGLDLQELSATVGRQLTPFCVIVPFWLIWAFVGFRKMLEVWPAILVAGVAFAVPQFLISNYHGPWLVNVVAAISSMGFLALFLKVWQPANPMTEMPGAHAGEGHAEAATAPPTAGSGGGNARVWAPWLILSLFVFAWGTPQVKEVLNGCPTALKAEESRSATMESVCATTKLAFRKIPVDGLNEQVQKMPPVVAKPEVEKAVYNVNILSATGTAIFIASIIAALVLGIWSD